MLSYNKIQLWGVVKIKYTLKHYFSYCFRNCDINKTTCNYSTFSYQLNIKSYNHHNEPLKFTCVMLKHSRDAHIRVITYLWNINTIVFTIIIVTRKYFIFIKWAKSYHFVVKGRLKIFTYIHGLYAIQWEHKIWTIFQ